MLTTGSGVNGPQQAQLLAEAIPRIERLLAKYTRPLLVHVTPGGELKVLTGTRRAGIKK